MVEHWSPKPGVVGSSPSTPAKHILQIGTPYPIAYNPLNNIRRNLMFDKITDLLGEPVNTKGNQQYFSIGDHMEQVLEILGLTQEDVDTSGGTAETLEITMHGDNIVDTHYMAQIVGSPNVDTGHAPVYYATKAVRLAQNELSFDETRGLEIIAEFQNGDRVWFLEGSFREEDGFSILLVRVDELQFKEHGNEHVISRQLDFSEVEDLMNNAHCRNANAVAWLLEKLAEAKAQ